VSTTAASVRDRLRNLAQERPQAFQGLLTRYGIERLLVRLAASSHADRFVLKGAQLLLVHQGAPHRPTKDLDLLGLGSEDVDDLTAVFRDVCTASVPDDSLSFHASSVTAKPIRESARYGGVRVRLLATLDRARVAIQIDVGFGDVVTPPAELVTFPVLLGGPAPTLRGYPLATMVAEKFESLASLGLATSRMKDLYDLWYITRTFDLPKHEIRSAIEATFRRRGTRLHATPEALTDAFWKDPSKHTQWRAFLTRNELDDEDLETVVREVAAALEAVLGG